MAATFEVVSVRYVCNQLVCVMAGGYTHSRSILYEPEASPALHQEDTEESFG
jgi:hypothetical protein